MKVGLLSLGCPKNLVDGEVMLGLVAQAGHDITSHAAEADVLVVNTCAFIDSAKQESVNAILEMAEHKRTGACQRLIVTGCLAERYRDEVQVEIPDIDAVLGTGEVPDIVKAFNDRPSAPARPAVSTVPVRFFRPGEIASPARRAALAAPRELPTYLYNAETPRRVTTPRHFAYVKVAEGCDYRCAFCIIPRLRGHYRSRPVDSIVQEAERLVERGVRELILVSQDTSYYGVDRGERGGLARLLRALDRITGLTWIRLLYLYPTTITDAMLAAMAECEKLCRYIDLPLQHAATRVLRRMRRPGSRRTYEQLLSRIRARVPGVALRTTFIVGFPGETETDLDELRRFIDDVAFDHVGVFTYSHEEGTRAFGLSDAVPAREKRRRRKVLMSLQQGLVARRNRQRHGERASVLVDGTAADHPLVLQGRLEGQAPEIDPVVYLTDCDPSAYAPGALVETEIVGGRGYDLVARPLA